MKLNYFAYIYRFSKLTFLSTPLITSDVSAYYKCKVEKQKTKKNQNKDSCEAYALI